MASLACGAACLAAASPAAAAPAAAPAIVSIAASPGHVPARGGLVTVGVSVRRATTCAFLGQPSPGAALAVMAVVPCGTGRARAGVRLGENTHPGAATIRYVVQARGPGGVARRTTSVVEAGARPAPPPAPPGPPAAPLSIVTTSLPDATTGVAYSATLSASGGTSPYAWSVSAGSLPDGLQLSAAGELTGTPTTAGGATVTVTVTDSTVPALNASATLSLRVAAAAVSPSPSVSTEHTTNWAGYVVEGGPFTVAQGTFDVPSLAASSGRTTDSEWVGIDGTAGGGSSLIQAGVTEMSDPDTGRAYTEAWWEILPAPATPVDLTVAAGDEVTVTIWQLAAGSTRWAIQLVDDTTAQTFTTIQTYAGSGTSAEWILEAPTLAATMTQETLGQFAPNVTFGNLGMTGTETALVEEIMVDENGDSLATPSDLTAAGFTVAYGSTAPPPP